MVEDDFAEVVFTAIRIGDDERVPRGTSVRMQRHKMHIGIHCNLEAAIFGCHRVAPVRFVTVSDESHQIEARHRCARVRFDNAPANPMPCQAKRKFFARGRRVGKPRRAQAGRARKQPDLLVALEGSEPIHAVGTGQRLYVQLRTRRMRPYLRAGNGRTAAVEHPSGDEERRRKAQLDAVDAIRVRPVRLSFHLDILQRERDVPFGRRPHNMPTGLQAVNDELAAPPALPAGFGERRHLENGFFCRFDRQGGTEQRLAVLGQHRPRKPQAGGQTEFHRFGRGVARKRQDERHTVFADDQQSGIFIWLFHREGYFEEPLLRTSPSWLPCACQRAHPNRIARHLPRDRAAHD